MTMDRIEAGAAVIARVGWDKDDADNEVFRAVLWFPKGPPDLPFNTAWDMTPVYLSLTPPQQAAATIQAQAKRLMALEALAQRVIDWHVRVNTPSPTGIDCAYLNGEDGDGWDDMEAIEKEARALLEQER